jgi:uncharacterized protein YbaR (Trm112 family)
MRPDTLDILRCPFCGGRFTAHQVQADPRDQDIVHGVLGCACAAFPVVDGIPILHLADPVPAVLAHLENRRPDLARQALLRLDAGQALPFDALTRSEAATYREAVAALGLDLEGTYFVHRFSDPSFVVAQALVRSVAATALGGDGRAIDICGGSGHLTRELSALTSSAPFLADVYFSKLWLARRFVAPGCEAVCCNGNHPLPFARGAFRFAMCADAFMFIWTKRRFVAEMLRLLDTSGPSAAMISHTHNQLVWSPSHGQPLPPAGYADLFETTPVRVFSEAGLFADVVRGGPIELGREDAAAVLDADPALVAVASACPDVFRPHAIHPWSVPSGVPTLNPLYVAEGAEGAEGAGDAVLLRLTFPSPVYEDEFGACRAYLPETVTVSRAAMSALAEGRLVPEMSDLTRRRVVLSLPRNYC